MVMCLGFEWWSRPFDSPAHTKLTHHTHTQPKHPHTHRTAAATNNNDNDNVDPTLPSSNASVASSTHTHASSAAAEARATPAALEAMRDFWREQGLQSKPQLEKLVGLAHTRKLYAEPERIKMKLKQVGRACVCGLFRCLIGSIGPTRTYPRTRPSQQQLQTAPDDPRGCGRGEDREQRAQHPGLRHPDLHRAQDRCANRGVVVCVCLCVCDRLGPSTIPTPRMHAQALKKILPDCDVVKVIVASPHLLTFNVEENIGPKIEKLKDLLPGVWMFYVEVSRERVGGRSFV